MREQRQPSVMTGKVLVDSEWVDYSFDFRDPNQIPNFKTGDFYRALRLFAAVDQSEFRLDSRRLIIERLSRTADELPDQIAPLLLDHFGNNQSRARAWFLELYFGRSAFWRIDGFTEADARSIRAWAAANLRALIRGHSAKSLWRIAKNSASRCPTPHWSLRDVSESARKRLLPLLCAIRRLGPPHKSCLAGPRLVRAPMKGLLTTT